MAKSSLSKVLLIASFFLVMVTMALAQPGQGGNPPGNPCPNGPPCNPDNQVPITGIEWLLVAGGGLGIKKLRDSQKAKKD